LLFGRSDGARRAPAEHFWLVTAGTAAPAQLGDDAIKVSDADFIAAAHRVNTSLHPLEEAMNKSPIAIVAALLAAATFFSSTAEAGFGIRLGFGGPLPGFIAHGNGGGYGSYHRHREYQYVERRRAKKSTTVAKRSTPSEAKVAKVEKEVAKPEVVAAIPAVEPDIIADSENSSITSVGTTAALDSETVKSGEVKAATTEPKREKTASKLDCKKFFPSVGMTLTVPCE
jgi:hypothetical protein